MSRRAGIAGLVGSVAILLLTIAVATGAGPSLPGPPVREWLGISEPAEPEMCEPDPKSVFEPPGRPGRGVWRVEPNAPVRSPEAGAVAIDGYVYLVGGQGRIGAEATVLRFDPRTGEYRRETDAPVAIDHPVVAAHGDELVLATGFVDGSDPTNRAWAYSPRTRRWSELPRAELERGGAAGAVVGDELYIAGGTTDFGNENAPVRRFEIYDFAKREWREGPAMPTARHHLGAAAVAGKVYFAGGRDPDDQSHAELERFDPVTGRWTSLEPIPVGTGALAVTEAAGKVVVTGGGHDPIDPGEPGGWILRAAFAYDPKTDRWERLPDMRRGRHGHAAATIGDTVYLFRGTLCPGYGESAGAESLRLR